LVTLEHIFLPQPDANYQFYFHAILLSTWFPNYATGNWVLAVIGYGL